MEVELVRKKNLHFSPKHRVNVSWERGSLTAALPWQPRTLQIRWRGLRINERVFAVRSPWRSRERERFSRGSGAPGAPLHVLVLFVRGAAGKASEQNNRNSSSEAPPERPFNCWDDWRLRTARRDQHLSANVTSGKNVHGAPPKANVSTLLARC